MEEIEDLKNVFYNLVESCLKLLRTNYLSQPEKQIFFAGFSTIHQFFIMAANYCSFDYIKTNLFVSFWKNFMIIYNFLKFKEKKFNGHNFLNNIMQIIDNEPLKSQLQLLRDNFNTLIQRPNKQLIQHCIKIVKEFFNQANLYAQQNDFEKILIDQLNAYKLGLKNELKNLEIALQINEDIQTIEQLINGSPAFKLEYNLETNAVLKHILDFCEVFLQTFPEGTIQEINEILQQIYIAKIIIAHPGYNKKINYLITLFDKIINFIGKNKVNDLYLLQEFSNYINSLSSDYWLLKANFSLFIESKNKISTDCYRTESHFKVFSSFLDLINSMKIDSIVVNELIFNLMIIYSKRLVFSQFESELNTAKISINQNSIYKKLNMSQGINSFGKCIDDLLNSCFLIDSFTDFMKRFKTYAFAVRDVTECVVSKDKGHQKISKFPIIKNFKHLCKWPDFANITSDIDLNDKFLNCFDVDEDLDYSFTLYELYAQYRKSFDKKTRKNIKKTILFLQCQFNFADNILEKKSQIPLLIETNDFTKLLVSFLDATLPIIKEKSVSSQFETYCFISSATVFINDSSPEDIIGGIKRIVNEIPVPLLKSKMNNTFRLLELVNLNINNFGNSIEFQNQFCQTFLNFCSTLDTNFMHKLNQIYSNLEHSNLILNFPNFHDIFYIFNQYESLSKSLLSFIPQYLTENDIKVKSYFPIIIIINVAESLYNMISMLVENKIISEDISDKSKEILELISSMFPFRNENILISSFLTDNLKVQLESLLHFLIQLKHIELNSFEELFYSKLSYLTSIFSNFLEECPQLSEEKDLIDDIIRDTQILLADNYVSTLYRILQNAIKLNQHISDLNQRGSSQNSFEFTSFSLIANKFQSLIIEFLNTISFQKDLSVFINCIISFGGILNLNFKSSDLDNIDSFFQSEPYHHEHIARAKRALTQLLSDAPQLSNLLKSTERDLSLLNTFYNDATPEFILKQLRESTRYIEEMIEYIQNRNNEISKIMPSIEEVMQNENQYFQNFSHLDQMISGEKKRKDQIETEIKKLNKSIKAEEEEIKFLKEAIHTKIHNYDKLVNQFKEDKSQNNILLRNNELDEIHDSILSHQATLDTLLTKNYQLKQMISQIEIIQMCKLNDNNEGISFSNSENEQIAAIKLFVNSEEEEDFDLFSEEPEVKELADLADSLMISEDFGEESMIFNKERHDKMYRLELELYKLIDKIKEEEKSLDINTE